MEPITDGERDQPVLVTAPTNQHRHGPVDSEFSIHQICPGHHGLHTAMHYPSDFIAAAQQRHGKKARQWPRVGHEELFQLRRRLRR